MISRFLLPALSLLLLGSLLSYVVLNRLLAETILQLYPHARTGDVAAQASQFALATVAALYLIVTPLFLLGARWYRRHLHTPLQSLGADIETLRNGGHFLPSEQRPHILEFRHIHESLRDFSEHSRRQYARERVMQQSLESHSASDPLTGLLNRSRLNSEIERLIGERDHLAHPFALFYLDLDNFKHINDTSGHDVGDDLLKACAMRIHASLERSDLVARVGADEFAVVINSRRRKDDFVTIASNLIRLVNAPFHIRGYEFTLTASVGISIYPLQGESAATLLKHADIAMNEAKAKGRNSYCLFHEDMSERIKKRLFLEHEMRDGLRKGEFALVYQPQVDTLTARVLGAEALIRWLHPEQGTISPDRFIGLAEKSGFIFELGTWILEEACSLISRNTELLGRLKLSVNISPMQFREPGFVEKVTALLQRYGVAPEQLVFEITESLIIADKELSLEILQRIKQMGISIAMDDFGTGYSSLSYLKEFPVDIIKIDKSFIQGAFDNSEDYNIVKAVVSLGNELGLQVVAEGVEQLHQYELLRASHCGVIQGYLFSKPLSETEYIEYLLKQNRFH